MPDSKASRCLRRQVLGGWCAGVVVPDSKASSCLRRQVLLLLVHRTVLRFAYIHHVRTRHVARIAVLVVRVLSRPGFHDSVTLVPAVAPLLLFGLSVSYQGCDFEPGRQSES